MLPRATSRKLSLAALLLALPLTACTAFSSAQAASKTTSQPGLTTGVPANLAKFYGQRLVWTSGNGCASGYQCSKLTVPLNYDDPGGATIQIAVVRKPATDQAHRLGSLVVNPGGPGGSGVSYATSGDVADASVLARYDLVGFDPRGVGASDPVECLTDSQMDQFVDTPPDPDSPAELAKVEHASQFFAQQCEAKSGALLPYVGTKDAARDMDILRAALGDKKLNYLGKSYGTMLGATYAEEFPQRVGDVVLDGAIDPNLSAEQENLTQAASFDKELHLFLADCVKQTDCPFGTKDPNVAFTKLQNWVKGLDADPITGDGTRKVDEAYALTGISVAMYDQGYWPDLRTALGDAMQRQRRDAAGHGRRVQRPGERPLRGQRGRGQLRGELRGPPGRGDLGAQIQDRAARIREGRAVLRPDGGLVQPALRLLEGHPDRLPARDQGGGRRPHPRRRYHERPGHPLRLGPEPGLRSCPAATC
jgi:pimeloyl-ACP methyl ester carboxylesterase